MMKSNAYLLNIAKAIRKQVTKEGIDPKFLLELPISRSKDTIWKRILLSSGEISSHKEQMNLKSLLKRNAELRNLVFQKQLIIDIEQSDWLNNIKKDSNGRERLSHEFAYILTEKIQQKGNILEIFIIQNIFKKH